MKQAQLKGTAGPKHVCYYVGLEGWRRLWDSPDEVVRETPYSSRKQAKNPEVRVEKKGYVAQGIAAAVELKETASAYAW